MQQPRLDDTTLLKLFLDSGKNPTRAAAAAGIHVRTLHYRLTEIEAKLGHRVRDGKGSQAFVSARRSTRPTPISLKDGLIVVGSDAHYWPGESSAAHRAFVRAIRSLKPDIVVMNGDEFDGAALSRHAPISWERAPSADRELEACKSRMEEIRDEAGEAKLLGTFGNHTLRIDTFLATHVAAVQGIAGTKFEDHFPDWQYAWAYMVNEHTLIKHRIRGGEHATWNNTASAQINTVTGHCHNMQVRPRSTMSPVNGGTIYGVDTGMLADPWGPQFFYLEQGPRNWRAGFAVLTFNNGILMPPELCQVVAENKVFFRGKLYTV
jgi:hypothetical protein